MQKAAIFIACVFIVVLSGCSKGTRLIKEPEPYQIAKPIASASDERLVATLDWVIVRLGPGAWAKNADWDEFLLRFENLSDSPLKIMSVTVFDSFDTRIETRSNRKQLVKGSKETKRRYADSDIKIMAGWGGGAIALAGDPCLDECEHRLDGDGKTDDGADGQGWRKGIALELEVCRHNTGDRRNGDDEDEYPEEDERAGAPLAQLVLRIANDICHYQTPVLLRCPPARLFRTVSSSLS
ncbi:MAG: hypothetical protein IIA90_04475 [Chloroflexi bacterium]|nr:hypothetical protein [Chloroflexota bacterium]